MGTTTSAQMFVAKHAEALGPVPEAELSDQPLLWYGCHCNSLVLESSLVRMVTAPNLLACSVDKESSQIIILLLWHVKTVVTATCAWPYLLNIRSTPLQVLLQLTYGVLMPETYTTAKKAIIRHYTVRQMLRVLICSCWLCCCQVLPTAAVLLAIRLCQCRLPRP